MQIKCIKDVVMNTEKKEVAYISGKIYKAIEEDRFLRSKDEQGDWTHSLSGPTSEWFKKYFEIFRSEVAELTAISFPILNNLTPTVQGCTNKLIEELGELLTLIGKGHQQSGESDKTVEQITEDIEMNMVREAFDVAQSAVTMAHTLCSKHGIDMAMMLLDHKEKLYNKGYLK